jgi:hypothetical protein
MSMTNIYKPLKGRQRGERTTWRLMFTESGQKMLRVRNGCVKFRVSTGSGHNPMAQHNISTETSPSNGNDLLETSQNEERGQWIAHCTVTHTASLLPILTVLTAVACFLLGYSRAYEFYIPKFRNTLSHLHRWVQTCLWRRLRWSSSSRVQTRPKPLDFYGRKNPQHAFLRRGSKRICPMSQLCCM